ncbi:transmembrane component [Aspergillus sclerotialis]|uniref:Transmembrane component n=1 Tax=Aspergillus sclerotialis TaxID=2070753 RepID=A0A3A2Z1R6_9EURO|nr:transmembrane component [Aspergillus sclerotialis]
MQRQMASFDQVIFFAGGSGITAIASQLLDLIKRMRDGKATTSKVHVVWAMKRPDIMEWFKEELRICRECAPPGSVQCHFFITAAKRYEPLPDVKEHRLSGIRTRSPTSSTKPQEDPSATRPW